MTAGGAAAPADRCDIDIIEGYRPGAIGRIAFMHADYYSRHWGFGLFFEARVAREFADFLSRLDPARDRLWPALPGDAIVEGEADQWGMVLPEQKFVLTLD